MCLISVLFSFYHISNIFFSFFSFSSSSFLFINDVFVLRFTSPFSCSVFFIKFCKASHAFIKIQKIKTPPTPKELHVYLKCIDSPLGDTPPATDGRDEFCAYFSAFGVFCFCIRGWCAVLFRGILVQIMFFVCILSVILVGAKCVCGFLRVVCVRKNKLVVCYRGLLVWFDFST